MFVCVCVMCFRDGKNAFSGLGVVWGAGFSFCCLALALGMECPPHKVTCPDGRENAAGSWNCDGFVPLCLVTSALLRRFAGTCCAQCETECGDDDGLCLDVGDDAMNACFRLPTN